MSPARQLKFVRSVRSYQLAALLKARRDDSCMSQNMVAASLGWSTAKVGHIETAARPARVTDVILLLDLYGVAGSQRDEIISLAKAAKRRNWWTQYVDVLNGPYIALEDEAVQICEWESQVIPGLLQTTEYAWKIMSTDPTLSAEEIGRRIDARRERRKVLERGTGAPHLRLVLDEAILGRPIGAPQEWREQLRHLADDAQRDNVTVQILPQSTGVHPGLDGSLIILRFAEDTVPDVAYCEGFFGGVWLESAPKVARCNLAFERLSDAALDPAASAALIEEAAQR